MNSPRGKVKIEWSANFAYAIGLIATDGCLSKDGRHVDFTSKDYELVEKFLYALGVTSKISLKQSGFGGRLNYYRVQIGDVRFYTFLQSIGLTPRKSKTISTINAIPDTFFPDVLRGLLDGDGHFFSYWDPRWRSSFLYYVVFNSASRKHIQWIQRRINQLYGLTGHITSARNNSLFSLKYAKTESNSLIRILYYAKDVLCLERKRLKIFQALSIVSKPTARVEKR